jgi:hypothetical protein
VIYAARAQPLISQTLWWKQYGQNTSDQLLSIHSAAMDVSTQLEILALPWLIFSIFSTGFILPVAYMSFLRWQYFVQPRMRLVVASWDAVFNRAAEHPSCPKQVRKVYTAVQTMVKKWAKVSHIATAPPMRAATSSTRK